VDDHGDTQATATPITPSASFTNAALEVSGDTDWFSFTAVARQALDFSCSTTNFDCDLGLYDSSGTLLLADTASSTSAQVIYRFAAAGTYFVKVHSGSTGYGSYSYRLNDRGVDDHSDTATGATVLTLGATTAGKIELIGDLDFFAVELVAGTSYTASTTGISTTLTVYGPDQTTVLGTGTNTRTFTSAAGGGTHYVRVQSASSGTYSVKVQ
jgi:hypothetical protein